MVNIRKQQQQQKGERERIYTIITKPSILSEKEYKKTQLPVEI